MDYKTGEHAIFPKAHQEWIGPQNVKTLLNKSLNIYNVKRTMFCLSFPSIDRATAPGRYEQFYLNVEALTKHVP